ncbi:MAG: type IV pilus modification PilV family protein [Rubripirellula sp.]
MNQHRHEGLTLIEVVVSTLLVSTIMLTSLAASANLLRNQAATRAKTEAQTLGTQILDEITAQDFEDRIDAQFGLEPDESLDDRMTFDDIDDYQKYGEANPTHRDGTAINGFADWTYEIEVLMVEAGENSVTSKEADSGSPLRLIRVRCISPEGAEFTSTALVADCATDAPSTTSYEKWRRIKLQFEDREISLATPLRNQPQATDSP